MPATREQRQRRQAVQRVRRARERVEAAQYELAVAIHEARGAGATIVEIGAAAAVSHQRISQITKKERG